MHCYSMNGSPDIPLAIGKCAAPKFHYSLHLLGVILRRAALRMKGGENSDSDQFSANELYNNLPDNDFDLIQLTEEQN